ncbi:Hypothetical protein PFR_JS22-PH_39 [Propionibacterium freudenreichii]|nr:Hypothetical protein PFR_JS22-PH_39 [Propionibacterium freudenreichii]
MISTAWGGIPPTPGFLAPTSHSDISPGFSTGCPPRASLSSSQRTLNARQHSRRSEQPRSECVGPVWIAHEFRNKPLATARFR